MEPILITYFEEKIIESGLNHSYIVFFNYEDVYSVFFKAVNKAVDDGYLMLSNSDNANDYNKSFKLTEQGKDFMSMIMI